MTELEKAGILIQDWDTRRVGSDDRPVYLKYYRLDKRYNWLEKIYKPSN
jgi:hypothetical protein